MANPLVSDHFVEFLLFEVLQAEELTRFPAFSEHSRATFEPYLAACRQVAREVLWPAYRPMDQEPPRFEGGRVTAHPSMRACWEALRELGVLSATRPPAVGGQQLPLTVATLAQAYLMAGNLSAYGYAGLTTGAAHLIETFGDEATRATYLPKMYEGRWSGTMALTEPQAGSSLADVACSATPTGRGDYLLRGAKIFISGGDHDVTENIVHLVLARLDGAPAGTRGISLFAVPRLRPEQGALVPNDVSTTGLIHKVGWKGLPSVALSFGEAGDCRGVLVGAANQGLKHMFQMMNEARIMVGVNAAATASVAFHEAVAYARDRRQGRPPGGDPSSAPVPLVAHADVRRMLLRQKAIVEGSLALVALTARQADVAHHSPDPDQAARAQLLLDLLTPVAKTFPAERGFEANALAVQVLGGYGYTTEFLPEAFLRDQKLNTIHEGTTGIQGLDLLGRKVVAGGGAALRALEDEVRAAVEAARRSDVPHADELLTALGHLVDTTAALGARGLASDVEGMLLHSSDFLELTSTVVVGWAWLRLATAAHGRDDDFTHGLRQAARYWLATEVPRAAHLAHLCQSGEPSYGALRPEGL